MDREQRLARPGRSGYDGIVARTEQMREIIPGLGLTTRQEIKRLPMVKPSGKYSVFYEITLFEGTSH